MAACRTSVKVQRGSIAHVDVHARGCPRSSGTRASPARRAPRAASCATRTASAKSVPGCGSRSMRSSSGWSTSSRRTGHGWKVMVPRLRHQATVASSVGATSSAVRPDGNAMCAVSTHVGSALAAPASGRTRRRAGRPGSPASRPRARRRASAPWSRAGRAAPAGCRRRPRGSSSTTSSLRDARVREVGLVRVGDLDGALPDLDLHEG